MENSLFFSILHSTWDTVLEASPWLLFGFFIAGIIHVFLPIGIVNKLLRKPGFRSIFMASVIGAPIPLCSCGIIPVMKSLRERGVSKGAAASFMTSTPEIGIGAFFLTQGLLGIVFALFRVVAAILSAILAGTLVETIKSNKEYNLSQSKPENSSCASIVNKHDHSDCCGIDSESNSVNVTLHNKSYFKLFIEAIYFGFYTLPKDLSFLLIIGFLISGAFAALLPSEFLTQTVSEPFYQMILALLVSLPLYICATSSTPIAAVLYAKGLSVGAVLVFLLAGAATNVSTILAAKNEFGFRGAVYYVSSIIFVSLCFGLFIEYGLSHDGSYIPHPSATFQAASHAGHDHSHDHTDIFSQIAAFFTIFLLILPSMKFIKFDSRRSLK